MSAWIRFDPAGKPAGRVVVTTQTAVGFRDIPEYGAVAGIELPRLLEIRQGIFPAALAPIDRSGGVPHFSIVRGRFLRDGELSPRQLIIAVAVVIIVGKREPDIARIRLETQRRVRRE